MTDCVARSVDDYAAIALRLGTDTAFAATVRKRIAKECDTIFDDPVFLDSAGRFLMTAPPVAGPASAG